MRQLSIQEAKDYLKESINWKNYRRNYKINADFFEKIDTEEKAYWLGFIMADGCILTCNNRSWAMSIALAEEDGYILDRLQNSLSIDVKIPIKTEIKKKETHQNKKSIRFYNNKLCYDLIQLNCTPRKSLTLDFPPENSIPDHLIHHFIRGYFDGDGGFITQKRRNDRSLYVKIVSSFIFLDKLLKVLSKFDIKGRIYNCGINESTSQLRLSQYESLKFYKLIYKDATIYLDRKFNLFTNFLKEKIKGMQFKKDNGNYTIQQNNINKLIEAYNYINSSKS